MIHYQSGIEWKDKSLVFHQLQHRGNRWFLVGERKNGETFSERVNKRVAKILLESGMPFGN